MAKVLGQETVQHPKMWLWGPAEYVSSGVPVGLSSPDGLEENVA